VRHQPYPAYTLSGVEWIGYSPKHWQIRRLKFMARVIMGQSPSSDEYSDDPHAMPFIQGNAEFGALVPEPRIFCDAAPKIAPTGSLLLSVRAPVGALNTADQPLGIGRGLCAIIPEPTILDSTFAWFLFSTARVELHSLATGSTYDAVSVNEVADMRLSLPPLLEQQAIAHFLDTETARMDTLVAKKRELMAKLGEKRAALISRTVTRGLPPEAARAAGLDPHPRLKPSGIEWLGDVPDNWKVTPMRHVMTGGTRNGLYKDPSQFSEDGVPFVQMGEAFAEPLLRKSANDRVLVSDSELETWRLQPGDLLFGRRSIVFSGSGKSVLVGLLSEPHVFESSLIRVRPDRRLVEPMYLFFFLSSAYGRAQVLSAAKQVTISGVDSQQIKSLLVLVPPVAEQRVIVDYLQRESAKVDLMTSKVESAIERLQEFRVALITAAVTGKIDVREVLATIESETPEAVA